MKSTKALILATLFPVTLFASGCNGGDAAPEVTPMSWDAAPAMQIDPAKQYFATVETTLGSFKIELFASESPLTVNNFVFLAKENYYNGVIFHRIMKAFMIQTGDQTGTGRGGPGYRFADELPVKHSYDPGIVAMANAGPNTNGSQFFICTGAQAQNLNYQPNYTQFGRVIEGMDVITKLASVPVVANSYGEVSTPSNPPKIIKITITEG
ncbi:peptidylprolyl isomerase [Dehalococcoides mccartyi]|uniref:peptidylprolyl isomerase n=1 Tax=Dehalococcoides mccartyi TaxID=61435 RepID=UPI002FC77A51